MNKFLKMIESWKLLPTSILMSKTSYEEFTNVRCWMCKKDDVMVKEKRKCGAKVSTLLEPCSSWEPNDECRNKQVIERIESKGW